MDCKSKYISFLNPTFEDLVVTTWNPALAFTHGSLGNCAAIDEQYLPEHRKGQLRSYRLVSVFQYALLEF